MSELAYQPVRNQPVAKFYYKGSHSHPVRRTVVVVENTPRTLTGYELREGSTIRSLSEAPIKCYRKDRIATYTQLGANKHRRPGADATTLRRFQVMDLLTSGA